MGAFSFGSGPSGVCDHENGPQAHFFGLFFGFGSLPSTRTQGGAMRETLIGLLEPEVTTRGCELVELEFHAHRGGGLLRIYIDRPGGETETDRVTVEDCETVSRAVSATLARPPAS